jgi:outer membrane receptor protein involved in Fe transport
VGRARILLSVLAVVGGLAPVARAERRVAVAYHGVRFLGLGEEEVSVLEATVKQALSRSRTLTLSAVDAEAGNRCKRDLHCHCRAARARGAGRAVYGNISRIGESYTVELMLVDTRSCGAESSVLVTETLASLEAARLRLAALCARLTTPLESLSQTVVKDERGVEAVPAVVTVFTGQQIRQLGITSLAELIALVPGFEALDTNSGTNVLHLGLTNTILYLIDGVPLSNPMFNFRTLSQDLLVALHHLERVEFVRGPGSVLWGPNAYLGMINLITRMPVETRPRLTLSTTGGTLGTGDFHLSLEQSHRHFRYHLSTTLNLSHGPRTAVDSSIFGDVTAGTPDEQLVWGNGGTTASEPDFYWDVVAKLEVIRRLQILVNLIGHDDRYQISPFGSLLAPGQGGLWSKWHRLYSIAWDDRLPLGLRYRLSASRYEYRFYESFAIHPASPTVPGGARYLQGNETEPQVSQIAEARLYHGFERGPLSNQALLGVSYLHQRMPNTYADLVAVDATPSQPTLDLQERSFWTVAGFAQEDLALWKRIFLSGGLRLEHRSAYGLVLSSQGALMATSRYLSGKLIYAEGFRPPEANQLYSTIGVKGNPALRPERSRALSLEAQTGLGPVKLRVGGTAAWLRDLIVLRKIDNQPGFQSQPENIGSTEIYAGFAELRADWPPLLSAFASYSYKYLRERRDVAATDPAKKTFVAPHTASFGLSVRPLDDLSLYATGALIGPRDVIALSPGTAGVPRRIGVAFDMSLGAWLTNLFDSWDLGLKLHNPLGIVHETPDSITGDPNMIVERRRATEVLLTLRFTPRLPALGGAEPAASGAPGERSAR